MLRLNLRRYENFCCYLTTVFPKALTSGLYLYGLYTILFDLCIPVIGGVEGFVLGLIGCVIFAQALYTYFKVISVGSGSPLDFPELRSSEHDEESLLRNVADDLESQLGPQTTVKDPPQILVEHSVQVKSNGKFRFCSKCQCWKPDRCHHCSSCKRCQLKMDHHCPWFATCVGYRNHKFFIQFLILSVVYTGFILLVTGKEVYKFFADESYKEDIISINILLCAILAFTMTISVGVFTLMSLYFLLTNMTTIEQQENFRYRNNMDIIEDSYYKYSSQLTAKDLGNVYNVGWRRNWCNVMGDSWYEWMLPVVNKSTSDRFKDNGLYFDTDSAIYERLQKSTVVQQQLLSQLNALQK